MLWTPGEAREHATRHTEQAIAALERLPGPVAPLRDLARRMLRRVV
jgi:hypothetical protein